MTRRCSHCSNNGHNSRTCPTRTGTCTGVRLFGVRLTDGSIIKKSASMGNLSLHYQSSSSAAASPNLGESPGSDPIGDPEGDGYLSDDPAGATCSAGRRLDRKKGVPWTEDEHRLFLLGLQKLGKGDWRGISRHYVTSRTPTQVASHAQKYFIRQCNATRRKRRSSLFDMVPEMQDEPTMPEDHFMLPPSQVVEQDDLSTFPSLNLSLNSEYEPMEATSDGKPEDLKETTPLKSVETPTQVPTLFPAFLPLPFSLWPSNAAPIKEEEEEEENKLTEMSHHEVFRPIPVVPKEPVKVDELVGMSQLSIKENVSRNIEPSSLTLNLLVGGSSRPSAFHANISSNESDFNGKGSG